MQATKFSTINEYLSSQPRETRDKLEGLRKLINEAAPKSEEVISYNMPAFRLHGNVLVYFAGNKNHIGFYPTASPIIIFKEELKAYKTSKGAIQFPLDKAIPKSLVKRIVALRIKESIEKAEAKARKNKLKK